MILRIIVYLLLYHYDYILCGKDEAVKRKCLTGYMTDVQDWVGEVGTLNMITNSMDISESANVVSTVQHRLSSFRASTHDRVIYFSMARCRLNRVPKVFNYQDSMRRPLFETVRFLSLYGNNFGDRAMAGKLYDEQMNATEATEVDFMSFPTHLQHNTSPWSMEFFRVKFKELRELDLRACSIQTLHGDLFQNMEKLEALYLGENNIAHIHINTFRGLDNLLHLDLSYNSNNLSRGTFQGLEIPSARLLKGLYSLASLDLSFTKLTPNAVEMLGYLGANFQRLSICETGIQLYEGVFNNTEIKYLDISGNKGILRNENSLSGIEKSLLVLYADTVGLKNIDTLKGFDQLQVLKLSNNEITCVTPSVVSKWDQLIILDLSRNRLTSWFNDTFAQMDSLSFLSLVHNNINVITEKMVKDIKDVDYIGLSENFFVCNCHAREFIDIARRNELRRMKPIVYNNPGISQNHQTLLFHTAFSDFDTLVEDRNIIAAPCNTEECLSNGDIEGYFVLFDYNLDAYKCLVFQEAKTIDFTMTDKCSQSARDGDFDDRLNEGRTKLLLLWLIPVVVLPCIAIGVVFRRWFIYFCITIKNSAMLSLINNGEQIDASTIFNYDVFVSYCNEDRAWVLDHLLPHVEKDSNVSVCLHERDFQVGLSILENIVSCMDRSKAIMLVISQKFLMSQWCQFEMHLAQHRLLETRREDLILILLEKIPRHMRPNTLHYLMLTKTYIVWPKEKSDQENFFRRLNKSMTMQRIKQNENVSLA